MNSLNTIADEVSNGGSINYSVDFPLQNPIPKISAIYVNDELVCQSPKGNQTIYA